MSDGLRTDFAPALLRGLSELGPVAPFSGDLALELGLSLWLRCSGTPLPQAREALGELRNVVLEVCGLDPTSEPVPLVGRSPRSDVVTLALYLADLLRRASITTGRSVDAIVTQVVAALPEPAVEALGA